MNFPLWKQLNRFKLPGGLRKIITAEQIRKADQFTIENKPIPSIELMEEASKAFVNSIEDRISKKTRVIVFCGTGNNGGDGLAVARILQAKDFQVEACLLQYSEDLSPDNLHNLNKLGSVLSIKSSSDMPDLAPYDLIIDAIFGSGLSRPITGWVSELIGQINSSGKRTFSIDIPSGLYCDKLPDSDAIIKADLTVSFQRPKTSFFFAESGEYVKEWIVTDIGLDEDFIQDQESDYYLLDERISDRLKRRKKHSHKGSYGHSLIMAGSYGKMGAAVLAIRACLRSGTGLLTAYVPKCGYEIVQSSVPEAMCMTDDSEMHFSNLPDLSPFNTIGTGPGIGKEGSTKEMIKELLRQCTVPLVLDADALNIISEEKDLIKEIPDYSILTPHPKEFERLVGKSIDSLESLGKQRQFSIEHQCIVVLKGAHTRISDTTGKVYFNNSGNPGMATGGSGDVLTGIITGLLAQRYDPIDAALIGVYYHGKSGDEAIKHTGMNALCASDLISFLKIEKGDSPELIQPVNSVF